METDPQRDR